jgi:mRNA interferase MazF
VNLGRGTIVIANLEPIVGHEQGGVRPCVTVSDPAVAEDQRYPLIAVVPVTSTPARGALYPELAPGKNGLTKVSYALIDHLRCVDKQRIRRALGTISSDELRSVDDGLELFLGLTLTRMLH